MTDRGRNALNDALDVFVPCRRRGVADGARESGGCAEAKMLHHVRRNAEADREWIAGPLPDHSPAIVPRQRDGIKLTYEHCRDERVGPARSD